MGTEMKKAVFLDRDGTINVDPGYLSQPDQMELLPHVGEALKMLQDDGYEFVIVSNQSGVGRGLVEESMLEKIHARNRATQRARNPPAPANVACTTLADKPPLASWSCLLPLQPSALCDCRRSRGSAVERRHRWPRRSRVMCFPDCEPPLPRESQERRCRQMA